jgi:hypothetical protein
VMDQVRCASPSPLRGGSDAKRPGRGARRMRRALEAALDERTKTLTDAPHPDGCAVDPPRKGEGGTRRLPRRKKS